MYFGVVSQQLSEKVPLSIWTSFCSGQDMVDGKSLEALLRSAPATNALPTEACVVVKDVVSAQLDLVLQRLNSKSEGFEARFICAEE